ncbi:MAG: tryptophan--tRNA ligase [Nitrospirae bacterium]|nr:tryptophan--tRNA ligase [Nitrospirota bacterium]
MTNSASGRTSNRRRLLSGMQPSGRLHLGNWLGALETWAAEQAKHDCYFFVADWHALSTNYQDTAKIRGHVREMIIDWLSAGLDPDRSTLFVQSRIPEHAVLHVILSMITPVPWLERNPTYKEKQEELKERDLTTYGFLGYPVLQAADILIYQPDDVPVGVDQLPHLELCREIARRFNHLYAKPVFKEPAALLSKTAQKIPGTDGRKMSKSYNNAIYLTDTEATVREKLKTMVTDPARVKRTDKGNPDICPVFSLHKILSPQPVIERVDRECRTAAIGCIDCKKLVADPLAARLTPLWEKRKEIERHPDQVEAIITQGCAKAQTVARQTVKEVYDVIGL